ncbi:MAG TPA: hypothetical protein VGE93_24660 [Bryobacteraceae bacterium]
MSTDSQTRANRANALHSTGPKTPEGKAKSSLNAVKTGLTGRTVLLPGDDANLYEANAERFRSEHQPIGDKEAALVQSIADAEWRLLRIPSLEAGIYALGRLEFAPLFENEDEAVRGSLADAKTFLIYQKQLNNLSVQEGRLRRQRDADMRALKEEQADRVAKNKARLNSIAQSYYRSRILKQEFNGKEVGFEFSEKELQHEISTWMESARRKIARDALTGSNPLPSNSPGQTDSALPPEKRHPLT